MAACRPTMVFNEPLKLGIFRRRYKRFFAEVDFAGSSITCHVPNTGSLKGCINPGAPCLFSISSDPKRKLPYTLQMIQDGGGWVGINTIAANSLVWEAWKQGQIPAWRAFDACQREVRINAKTRLDLAMWKENKDLPASKRLTPDDLSKHRLHFVEIKSVTMAVNKVAMFPDAVTSRGQKHLREMMDLVAQGHSAELVFLVQRNDCHSFAPADDIDPKYGQLLRQAIESGVKISIFPCELSPTGIQLEVRRTLSGDISPERVRRTSSGDSIV